MSRLLDLAPELFEHIVHILVEAAPLPDIFNSRSICRTFAKFIDHALLDKLSLTELNNKIYNSSMLYGWRPYKFFDERIGDYFINQCWLQTPCDISANLVAYVNDIVDRLLLEQRPECDSKTLREQYLCYIVRAAATLNQRFVHDTLIPYAKRPRFSNLVDDRSCLWECDEYVHGQYPDDAELLAAAAAVGDLELVKKLVKTCPRFSSGPILLCNPLGAAAANGRLDILEYFAQLIRATPCKISNYKYISKGPFGVTLDSTAEFDYRCTKEIFVGRSQHCYYRALISVINQLIESQRHREAAYLINLIYDLSPELRRIGLLCDYWPRIAIETGSTDTLEAIISTKPFADMTVLDMTWSIVTGFLVACKRGHTDMIRYLLEQPDVQKLLAFPVDRRLTELSGSLRDQLIHRDELQKHEFGRAKTCFEVAVRVALMQGNRDVVRTLLAQNDVHVDASAAFEGAISSRIGSKLLMMEMLLGHGWEVSAWALGDHGIPEGIEAFSEKMWKKMQTGEQGAPSLDEIRVTLLLGLEAKKWSSWTAAPNPFLRVLRKLCGTILSNRSFEPVDTDMWRAATKLHDWIESLAFPTLEDGTPLTACKGYCIMS